MASIHKTSQGREIDIEKLILQNEEVRAVGNMGVNARGDVINSENKTVAHRAEQVNKNYRKQIGTVAKDTPVIASKKAIQATAEQYVAETIAGLDDEKGEVE